MCVLRLRAAECGGADLFAPLPIDPDVDETGRSDLALFGCMLLLSNMKHVKVWTMFLEGHAPAYMPNTHTPLYYKRECAFKRVCLGTWILTLRRQKAPAIKADPLCVGV